MLEIGDKAPAFSLKSDAGDTVRLSDFKGKSLIVYFYPKDSTPGCTREAIAFTELLPKLRAKGAEVVGVSKDSVASHCSFRDKYKLKIPLLSDPDLGVHKAFGAFGEKLMYGKKVLGTIRSTFLVGPDGRVAAVWPSVKVDGHAEKVLERLGGAAPVAKTVTPKKRTAERPAAKKPAAKKPAAKRPAAKRPAAKRPAAKR